MLHYFGTELIRQTKLTLLILQEKVCSGDACLDRYHHREMPTVTSCYSVWCQRWTDWVNSLSLLQGFVVLHQHIPGLGSHEAFRRFLAFAGKFSHSCSWNKFKVFMAERERKKKIISHEGIYMCVCVFSWTWKIKFYHLELTTYRKGMMIGVRLFWILALLLTLLLLLLLSRFSGVWLCATP